MLLSLYDDILHHCDMLHHCMILYVKLNYINKAEKNIDGCLPPCHGPTPTKLIQLSRAQPKVFLIFKISLHVRRAENHCWQWVQASVGSA